MNLESDLIIILDLDKKRFVVLLFVHVASLDYKDVAFYLACRVWNYEC